MSREDSTGPTGLSTHTSTNQWQSFEMRMRRRRAERCVVRAEVALEAGFPEDARLALEEARRLDCSTPDFETLAAAVARPTTPPPPPGRPPQGRSRSAVPVGTLIMLATITVGSGWLWSSAVRRLAADAATTAPVHRSTAADVALATPSVRSGARNPTITTEFIRPEIDPSPETRKATTGQSAPATQLGRLEGSLAQPEQVVRAEALPSLPPETVTPTPAPENPQPRHPDPADTSPNAPVASPPPAPTAPAVARGTGAMDESQVRAALRRYEVAYSTLNVGSVQAVWPGVDARSLARAFDGLQSQRISLGQCAISMDGATARAECGGSATWTPRIGSGTRTANRAWTFELRNVGGSWEIVRVRVR